VRLRRAATAAALTILLSAATAAAASAESLLPDIDEGTPDMLQVEPAGSEWHLGFRSRAYNGGRGALRIRSERADTTSSVMTADQIIDQSGGGTVTQSAVGHSQYATSPTHEHWHFLRFESYELRRVADYSLAAPDMKTGFCLVDGYTLTGETPEGPPQFNANGCQPNNPDALAVEVGISAGYGDLYAPIRDGQYVDLTGAPAGRYYLVHRANPDRALTESDYDNNDSSVLVEVSWPGGPSQAPRVELLRNCRNSEKCPPKTADPEGKPVDVVTTTSATLTGRVAPNGAPTSWAFEHGPTTALGLRSAGGTVPAGDAAVDVSDTITGLSPGTTYYCRLATSNVGGHSYSPTRSFTTASDVKAAGPVDDSGKLPPKLKARLVRSDSRSLTVELNAPGTGTASARALLGHRSAGLASRRASRAGKIRLRVPLNRSSRTRLARAGKLKLTVRTRWRPKSGASQAGSLAVTLKARRR
jgi:hypothetical protein